MHKNRWTTRLKYPNKRPSSLTFPLSQKGILGPVFCPIIHILVLADMTQRK